MEIIKVGDKLGKISKVLRIIGGPSKSGMGIVYVCYNSLWKRKTAVKTFQNRFFSSVDAVNAFKLEALAWINLERHPFIVMAHTVENIYGRPFLHLEYIAPDKFGRNTLTHYLRSPISLKKALQWGVQFCHAMEYSITRGVTPHQDVKPDNIMITHTQDLKITDFGLAKLWNSSSFLEAQLSYPLKDRSDEKINNFGLYKIANNKKIAGSPPWMAPEQFEGIADIKSDIYSFGIVLFQMANHGKLPFIANSIEGYKEAHQKHPLPRFESSLFPIVKKCMEKSPEDRYLTFNDLRLDIEDLYRKETGENYKISIGSIEYDSADYEIRGSSFLSLGLYGEAIEAFNKSLTLDNNEPTTFNNLGLAYLYKGVYDKAIDAFDRAINLSPEYEPSYVNLVSTYMRKCVTLNDPSILFEKIKSTLDKLLEINPKNAEGLQNLALYYAGIGKNYDKAVELLIRCIELNPNNPNPYTSLGTCYTQMGMIDKAFEAYKKSMHLNPMDESVLYKLGELFLAQKMYEEAFPIFQRLTRINPVHELGLRSLGALFLKQNMHEEAFTIFQRLTRISPTNTNYQETMVSIRKYLLVFKNKKISNNNKESWKNRIISNNNKEKKSEKEGKRQKKK